MLQPDIIQPAIGFNQARPTIGQRFRAFHLHGRTHMHHHAPPAQHRSLFRRVQDIAKARLALFRVGIGQIDIIGGVHADGYPPSFSLRTDIRRRFIRQRHAAAKGIFIGRQPLCGQPLRGLDAGLEALGIKAFGIACRSKSHGISSAKLLLIIVFP